MSEEQFREWAILEIMGHQTYAGVVSEQVFSGTSFARIDVPEIAGRPAFSKMFGASSIYCITPVTEEVARMRATALGQSPLTIYDLPDEIRQKIRQVALPSPTEVRYDDDDCDW